jgi:hypothetical protein
VVPAGDTHERADSRATRDRRERVLGAGANPHVPYATFPHERHRGEEIGRCRDIGDLPSRELELTRRAPTLPETGEIERERGDPLLGQTQSVGASHLLFHGEPRASDDHCRLRRHQFIDVAIDASHE